MNSYERNIKKYEEETLQLEKQIKQLSLVRLFTFLLSLSGIIYLANERLLLELWIVIPICVVGFSLLLSRYNKVVDQKKKKILLIELNQNELTRLTNNLSEFPSGDHYLQRDHAYINDLDIFGPHSLYQLLNRTTTESGSDCLAAWLSQAADKEVITARQDSIRELTPQVEWRQELQVSGVSFQNKKSDFQKLLAWFESGEKLLAKQFIYISGSIILGLSASIFTVIAIIQLFTVGPTLYMIPFLITLLINNLLLRKISPLAEDIIDHTHTNVQILGGYERLAETISKASFQTEGLVERQKALEQNETSATTEIKKLKKILETFQLRGTKKSIGNAFYGFMNNLWLFDVYYIILTEKWKARNRQQVQPWIKAISEFEVLSSLAGFAYNNQDFPFPTIEETPYTIQFEKLGHPLIHPAKRVCNDFTLTNRGHINMITGSNMAGKSTFLRTIGVNMVLGLMGAPCCATASSIGQINMFTSMRTQDNLEEGTSSFYAELRRVQQLLALIGSGVPMFFMLDEMFKGTNSKDRYRGGVSLIKQLSDLNAFGLISTHDLELAKLADKHMIVTNSSFNSQIIEGKMTFDYQLKEGICTDFNASELMRKSGINILEDFDQITAKSVEKSS